MNATTDLPTVLHWLRANWFRVTVIVLLLYIFFSRELAFQVHISAPEPSKEVWVSNGPDPFQSPETEGGPAPVQSDKLGLFPRLFGDGSSELETSLDNTEEFTKVAYLQRFLRVARTEQERFGIPASVVLAVSLYESTAGKRPTSRDGFHNHFGLRCAKGDTPTPVWKGQCLEHAGVSYRQYESAWASFRDFSLAASQLARSRPGLDARAWVRLLAETLYAHDSRFERQVLGIIERYDLTQYDR